MSKVSVRAECCQTCSHWVCSNRRIVGDPPDQVEVYSDSNRCSLCSSIKEWREWCGSYENFRWLRNTYRPDPQTMKTSSEAFLDSVMALAAENRRNNAAAAASSQPKRIVRTCTRCAGSGKVSCNRCNGTGKESCSHCDGKGGFSVSVQIKEEGKNYTRRSAWMLRTNIDGDFWEKGWDWNTDPDAVRQFDRQHVVCSKTCQVEASESQKRKIQEEVLKVSPACGDFHLPEGLSEEQAEKTIESYNNAFNSYLNKCKEIEDDAAKWGEDWWRQKERIKTASLSITDTPCLSQVAFKDKFGFRRIAIVNLASKKVYLNEVSEEERKRRMPELEAEAANDADLQNVIGQMYGNYPDFKGYASKDMELAAGWFMRAAKAGHADAMDNLGNCYKSGNGVEKDEELAAAWYAKAAKAGHPWGQFHYADVLEDGKGVPKDDELAVAWYLKAARQGLADAQWRLGCRIADGRGTEKDKELGEAWKERAKANGYEPW